MTRHVSRFGHGAKVWLFIVAFGYLIIIWIGPRRIEEGWAGYLEMLATWTLIGGANIWIQMSQRVWFDDQHVCSRVLGKGCECLEFSEIISISASHSWKRAVARRPISELEIKAGSGRSILISLRHFSLPGLQQMVDEIHRQTGLSVPELRKSVI